MFRVITISLKLLMQEIQAGQEYRVPWLQSVGLL